MWLSVYKEKLNGGKSKIYIRIYKTNYLKI